jgi:predicted tellurium resistance membrane protein TerC
MRINPLSRTLEKKVHINMFVNAILSVVLVGIGLYANKDNKHLSTQLSSSFLAIIVLLSGIGINIVRALDKLAK